MRVCLDGSVIRPPLSGVQHSVQQELLSLRAPLSEDRVSLCCRDALVCQAARSAGWTLAPLPPWSRLTAGRILWQQVRLPTLLRRRNAEVLHALAYTAPLRCPIPYVLNVHDIIALEHPELCAPLNVLHMRTLLPRSIARAAACIVSTQDVARRLVTRLGVPEERIVVAPLGVDAPHFTAPAELPDSLKRRMGSKPYLLFVGNLEPKKGLDTLLDAYAAMTTNNQVDLLLAGRAAWRCKHLVERIRNWSGPGEVRWLGRIPGDSLPALYQHARVMVMPSLAEGFGMPVLEAMAAGTPVVHSDHPALVEAAGGAGICFRRGDAGDLVTILDSLIPDAARRGDMTAAGREWAATCTWQRWGDCAGNALRSVARARRGPAPAQT